MFWTVLCGLGFFSDGHLKTYFHLQFKILNVPMSSQLAANHWNQQQAEQEERMRMKKLTLDINERQEQEDYQGKKITTYLIFLFRGAFVDLQKVLFVMISS